MRDTVEVLLGNFEYVALDLAKREIEIFAPDSKFTTNEAVIKYIMREWAKGKIGIEEYYGNYDAE